jgi:hypothetical protein
MSGLAMLVYSRLFLISNAVSFFGRAYGLPRCAGLKLPELLALGVLVDRGMFSWFFGEVIDCFL